MTEEREKYCPYDRQKYPNLYALYYESERDSGLNEESVQTLLRNIQILDNTVKQMQKDFTDSVCIEYDGKYLYNPSDMIRMLMDAVRTTAIRIEQVPEDLRGEVSTACAEYERYMKDE
jgi:hypothetical protein